MRPRHSAPSHISPALTRGDDLPLSPCAVDRQLRPRTEPTPYDVLYDHSAGPIFKAAQAAAQEICGRCPIRDACLTENAREPWAIAVLGREKTRRIGRPRTATCGTPAGWAAHYRDGEKPCQPCKDARAAYLKARKTSTAKQLAAAKGRAVRAARLAEANEARMSELRHMVANGVSVSQACRRLDVSRDTLQRWCSRHGVSDLFRALTRPETLHENQAMRRSA